MEGFVSVTIATLETLLKRGNEGALRVWLALAMESTFTTGENKRSSYRGLQARHGLSLKCIERSVRILEKLGLIKVTRGHRRKNVYQIFGMATVAPKATDSTVPRRATDLLPSGLQDVAPKATELLPSGTLSSREKESRQETLSLSASVVPPWGPPEAEKRIKGWKLKYPKLDIDKTLSDLFAWLEKKKNKPRDLGAWLDKSIDRAENWRAKDEKKSTPKPAKRVKASKPKELPQPKPARPKHDALPEFWEQRVLHALKAEGSTAAELQASTHVNEQMLVQTTQSLVSKGKARMERVGDSLRYFAKEA